MKIHPNIAALRFVLLALIAPASVFALTPSTVTLIASPNPSNYGQAVALSATVTPGATGTVTFYDGTAILGVGTISGSQATLSTVMLASGTRSLRAYYGGDPTYAASSSTPLAQTVVAGISLGLRNAALYPSTTQSSSIAVGDFNGDSIQDFVVADGSGAINVLIGNGDGTFRPAVVYAISYGATGVVVADFNGDGKMDLAVTGRFSSSVAVLLGNGDGSFQTPVNRPAGVSPYSIAAGDFNGDGKADLVLVSASGFNLVVLLGNGDGSFAAAVSYAIGASQYSVAVGDFNGDGKPDIVAGTTSGISVLLGNGDGTFATAVSYPGGTFDYGIGLGDFNGDGKVDVAVSGGGGVYVLLGNGNGTFGAPVTALLGSTIGLIVTDFDGDGNADLAMVRNSGLVSVLAGNGDGTFKAPVNNAAGQNPYALAVGDFNRDGKADLIVGDAYISGFREMLGGAIPDLAISVTRPTGFTQGQVGATYNITVSNVGDFASTGALGVVIALPAGLTARSLGGNGWTCDLASLACARSDSLAIGGTFPITLKVDISVALTGNVTSTFSLSGGNDQNPANNVATDTTFVRFFSATTLTSSPNPAVLGHPVTLTATVTASATGTVTFYDGVVPLGSATLTGGQAVFTTSLLPSGSRSLRAEYVGDSNYGPSVSAIRTQTVNAVAANGVLPSTSYKTGAGSNWIGTGDFNGDGKPDLVTADLGGNTGTISVLLGRGDGSFNPAVIYPAGDYANSAAVADFNRDGRADVVIATNSGVYVLLGNGDGTFQNAVRVSPQTSYSSLVSADFNIDGQPDVAVLSNAGVVLFIGKGDGTFQAPVPVSSLGTNIAYLKVADMNSDGKPDLVGLNTNYGSGVAVSLGNGDGTFQTAVIGPAISNYPSSFAIGDFNGDGKPDVAIIYWVGVSLQLGNGDGTLQASIQTSLGFTPGSFAVSGDFNGDGKLDLAYSGYYSNAVYVAFGNGDGTFQYGISGNGSSFVTDGYSNTLVQADFNGDGKPDFAVSNSGPGTVNVFIGGLFSGLNISATHTSNFIAGQTAVYKITIQNPLFAVTSGTITVTDTLPTGLTASAISGLGWNCTLGTLTCTRTDALLNNLSYQVITIALNVSAGLPPSIVTNHASVTASGITNTAADPTTIVSPTTTTLAASPNPSSLGQTVTLTATVTAGATGSVQFLDNAAPLGVVILSGGQASFSTTLLQAGLRSLRVIYLGDSTHGPSTSAVKAQTVNASAASGLVAGTSIPVGVGPAGIAMADFNGDNKVDLVTANSTANTVSVVLGNGNGTFGANTDYAVGTKPVAVVVGDFNNDGKTDIAVVNQTSNNVSILLGNGNGTFQPAVQYATGLGPISLATGDFNGDGSVDLLVLNGSTQTAGLLLGNGNGTFRSGGTISGYSAATIAVGDFNLDGKADIVLAYYGYFYVLLGNGDGTFQQGLYNNVNYSYAMAIGDLNGDGKADLVTADNGGVNVLIGNGDGTFQPAVRYTAVNQAIALLFADVNGDGKVDLLVVNGSGNAVSVLLGNGNGTLQPPISYSVGSNPQGAVAGDFNGDGRTDLAVANLQGNNVSVLLGVLTPIFSVTSFHGGSFGLGQIGAAYTITVTNNGPGATSGLVTVTDTLPAGLFATAISGTGWACTLATLTCTRSDSLGSGNSYPVITITMNVTLGSPSTLNNIVSVSGGGAIGAMATDPTPVGLASLRITKTHIGNFAPGQTGATYTITVSNQSGPVATSGTVTVNENIPSGLIFISMAGSGWACVGASCNRSDALAGGSSYPPIIVTVNVSAFATSPQVNAVGVSGGNSANASATDSTQVSCSYQLSGNGAYSSSSASGALIIGGLASCGWTASTAAAWIHFTSAISGSGNGQVNYTVDANPTAVQRSATILISGQPFTILQGAYIIPVGSGLRFVPVTPCRIADTRNPAGAFGGPNLAAATPRNFSIQTGPCGIPTNAQAYSLNLTVVPLGPLGFLSVWPAGQSQPPVSTLNSSDGRIKANAAIVPAGTSGAITLFASDATHVIVDINGYFVPASGNANLAFYPLTACRIADTRIGTGAFGGPSLVGGISRNFPLLSSTCGIPATAQAYALNITAVPTAGQLGFLSVWPAGSPQPGSSTLNAPTGAITANAAIVPAGTGGGIAVIATNPTDVIIDINGYFAPPGSPGGMQFYSSTPCRILDTRDVAGAFGGPQLTSARRDFVVTASACGVPATAGAYSLNATVVPAAGLGFLTLWGAGTLPGVSTLNAGDGSIVANAALVPASASGSVSAIASNPTHLILDINGYFQ